MSKTITMNIRMDEDTRKKLKDFAGQVGIPATSLVNAGALQISKGNLDDLKLRTETGIVSTSAIPLGWRRHA